MKLKLLSKGNTNAKTIKNELETYILYLAPANTEGSVNVCPFASKGCIEACLNTAGRGAFSNVQQARIRKTRLWAEDRQGFYRQLNSELEYIQRKAVDKRSVIAVRLNGTSDIDHLDMLKRYANMEWMYSKWLTFYDYTKNPNIIRKYKDTNYNLTFSRSEENEGIAMTLLREGANVAMVFAKEIPVEYKGFKVINGDETDLRINDEKNVIVGLKAKGRAKKDVTGFVIK
jgi:hypothetical protein